MKTFTDRDLEKNNTNKTYRSARTKQRRLKNIDQIVAIKD